MELTESYLSRIISDYSFSENISLESTSVSKENSTIFLNGKHKIVSGKSFFQANCELVDKNAGSSLELKFRVYDDSPGNVSHISIKPKSITDSYSPDAMFASLNLTGSVVKHLNGSRVSTMYFSYFDPSLQETFIQAGFRQTAKDYRKDV